MTYCEHCGDAHTPLECPDLMNQLKARDTLTNQTLRLETKARESAEKILRDLKGRRGVGHELNGVMVAIDI